MVMFHLQFGGRGTSWEVLVASRAQLLAASGIKPARYLSPARYRLEIVPR